MFIYLSLFFGEKRIMSAFFLKHYGRTIRVSLHAGWSKAHESH